MRMVITEENRDELIADCKADIEVLQERMNEFSGSPLAQRELSSLLLRQQICLAVLSGNPSPVLHLPPPITEEDGYRLNTSWHAGAIFRDGANWMLEQAKQMQPPLKITLPDTGSKAFWHGSGKAEVFLPTAYKRWVKEAIERDCAIFRVNVEVK